MQLYKQYCFQIIKQMIKINKQQLINMQIYWLIYLNKFFNNFNKLMYIKILKKKKKKNQKDILINVE